MKKIIMILVVAGMLLSGCAVKDQEIIDGNNNVVYIERMDIWVEKGDDRLDAEGRLRIPLAF